VKEEGRSIGTVDKIYPPGMRFALAGMTWETLEVNKGAKVIFVRRVEGVSVVDWNVDFEFELHTALVRMMRKVLLSGESYPYLSESCAERLAEIRYVTGNSGILRNVVTPLSDIKYAIFPWIGTRQLAALHFALRARGVRSKMQWDSCMYLEAAHKGGRDELARMVGEIAESGHDPYALPIPPNAQVISKYNEFVPPALVRKQYVEDYLDFAGLKAAMADPDSPMLG
ncbi:MAG: hypothetical protein FWE70_03730, partial [Oscillospiraceae bacterium]|nr:hypothetical protein [Oscillospiraceae bacterium]